MKIKSKNNVITNSSDEVFLLRTTESLEEVKDWLKKNIKWYNNSENESYPFTEPIILEKGDWIMDWLVDFYDLWDSHDLDSVEDYKIKHCLCYATYSDYDYDFCVKKGGRLVVMAFSKYCEEHEEEITNIFKDYKWFNTIDDFWERNNNESYNDNCIFIGKFVRETKVRDFISNFCKWFEKEYPDKIPKWWNIPEHLDLQYWKGKIGFCTSEENSIPWEDMEKICEKFDGEHFHMG